MNQQVRRRQQRCHHPALLTHTVHPASAAPSVVLRTCRRGSTCGHWHRWSAWCRLLQAGVRGRAASETRQEVFRELWGGPPSPSMPTVSSISMSTSGRVEQQRQVPPPKMVVGGFPPPASSSVSSRLGGPCRDGAAGRTQTDAADVANHVAAVDLGHRRMVVDRSARRRSWIGPLSLPRTTRVVRGRSPVLADSELRSSRGSYADNGWWTAATSLRATPDQASCSVVRSALQAVHESLTQERDRLLRAVFLAGTTCCLQVHRNFGDSHSRCRPRRRRRCRAQRVAAPVPGAAVSVD